MPGSRPFPRQQGEGSAGAGHEPHARLYLLDEPIGGVDPAARDYILNTIISNYSKDATVVISTHLIEDIEPVLDEAVF